MLSTLSIQKHINLNNSDNFDIDINSKLSNQNSDKVDLECAGNIFTEHSINDENIKNNELTDIVNKYHNDSPHKINCSLKAKPVRQFDLMVSYDAKNKNFNIYNSRKIEIGLFGIDHIIKYISEPIDNDFLKYVADYDSAKELIQKFIIKDSKTMTLYTHDESPFMGDIELLMRLNIMLAEYRDIYIDQDLSFKSNKNNLFLSTISNS